jgi:hypothetical protein
LTSTHAQRWLQEREQQCASRAQQHARELAQARGETRAALEEVQADMQPVKAHITTLERQKVGVSRVSRVSRCRPQCRGVCI